MEREATPVEPDVAIEDTIDPEFIRSSKISVAPMPPSRSHFADDAETHSAPPPVSDPC